MKDQDKTKEQLINELAELRQVITLLEESETEHSRSVQALQKSVKRYRSLTGDVLDSSRVGIFVLDSDFKVVMINNGLELYFGLQRENVVGKDKRRLIEKRIKNIFEDPESFSEKVLATYDNNTYIENFECHVLAEGEREERWLEHWSQPVISGIYAGGRIEQYTDITLRKLGEDRIRHLNTVLKAIRKVNEIIGEANDPRDLIRRTCYSLTETRGYYNAWIALFDEIGELSATAEAGLGEAFASMVEFLKDSGVGECGRGVMGQPGVHVVEDPAAACIECPLAPKYVGRSGMGTRLEGHGKVYGILTVSISREFAFDIEEQELLEEVAGDIGLALYNLDLKEERKRAEEKYRTLFEDSRDAIYVTTRNGLFTDANQSFFALFGYTREEIAAINARQLYVNPDDRHRFWEEIEQKGYVKDFEVKLKKKDGTGMDCLLTATVQRADDGNIFGYQGITRDVTEHRNMEEQLRQAQKMEAIGVLAGGVAHDFNNILTTIIGNASLALMEVGKGDPLRKEIEEIREAGERAASLTRQLLAFSRKQIIQPEILDLNGLLTGIEKMLGRLIGEDVELLTIPGPELWQVEVDPGQMEQVIMNLVINARDAMPKGGKLTIETVNVDLERNYFRKHGIKEGQPGPYVMLAVSDTGIGIDKETRKHIFEPFFTTKGVGKGTGLGLSTVYGIVKQNNGFVWVYSEPGQGTTFKVYLPNTEGDVASEKEEQHPATGLGGSETVLIVEDDDSLRRLSQRTLQQHGYRVLEAENGEDALRVSEAHDGSIDLLITDVVMPKMGGKETAEGLQPLYPQMKVIYMSGYTDNAIARHGVLAPGLNFLEKPFSLEALARKVREVLDQQIDD